MRTGSSLEEPRLPRDQGAQGNDVSPIETISTAEKRAVACKLAARKDARTHRARHAKAGKRLIGATWPVNPKSRRRVADRASPNQ